MEAGDATLEESSFFALVSRMKYIERWALMRSTRPENLSEHSLEVAVIAHALATIANVRYGRSLDAGRAALMGMFHDASEIITGDMPTPVKYANGQIRDAYKDVEANAEQRLLDELPQDLAPAYRQILCPAASDAADGDEAYLRGLVKAADKLSALIKCLDETHAGNAEFRSAQATTQASVDAMAADHPEVADFVEQFLPPFGKTLDELL
ncbi:5'-deoxynucleotidase [Olsenella umbonata]|uniref:5'-deoxynucleotidase n=1 Tax=Parafannyhessea umbonata TaxID=604330 RepID=A0A7X9T8V5_9ACTN|nr:5'-deoxynucleotidase [Parafannyhessea umbonata]NMF25022.1 5'-deoxynucleotidase [Parafannyhessea umbonata]